MAPNPLTHSIEFFDTQFRRQAAAQEYVLNPFEQVALPFLSGEVLDLGCGLGNLSMAAAQKGCKVVALDGSPTAVGDLASRAKESGLAVEARLADLRKYSPDRKFDSVACIGLAMFFACPDARGLVEAVRDAVRPGGIAVVNVLIEGTTFLGMFTPGDYCLFAERELEKLFEGWSIEYQKLDEFPAPGETRKRFGTLVARKPHQRHPPDNPAVNPA